MFFIQGNFNFYAKALFGLKGIIERDFCYQINQPIFYDQPFIPPNAEKYLFAT